MDTIFFGKSIEANLIQLQAALKPKGRLGIFYSEFRFDPSESAEKLAVDRTQLAHALNQCDLPYQVWDFTREHYDHMRLKHQTAQALKSEFEAEGNTFLYQNITDESTPDSVTFETFKDFSARYLYLITNTTNES